MIFSLESALTGSYINTPRKAWRFLNAFALIKSANLLLILSVTYIKIWKCFFWVSIIMLQHRHTLEILWVLFQTTATKMNIAIKVSYDFFLLAEGLDFVLQDNATLMKCSKMRYAYSMLESTNNSLQEPTKIFRSIPAIC